MFKHLLDFLIYGCLLSAVIGLISTWIDRWVTARVQWRVGPPLLQPFYDIVKLLGKEIIIPNPSRALEFLGAPLLGLAGIALVATILWKTNLASGQPAGFVGDLIVVIYLLLLPSLALIIGGSASGNPYSVVGASREMKLMLAYELPFLLCISLVILKSGYSLSLVSISNQAAILSVSGVMAFVIALLCIQAKLAFVPFDVAESETELMGGPLVEYSGASLAVFKLTQAIMLFSLPVFLITLFMGGLNFQGIGILWSVLKYVLVLVLIVLIKNTNPRLRIDQALDFFWRKAFGLAVLALLLAILGQNLGIEWL